MLSSKSQSAAVCVSDLDFKLLRTTAMNPCIIFETDYTDIQSRLSL